jgi:hypothetical protein
LPAGILFESAASRGFNHHGVVALLGFRGRDFADRLLTCQRSKLATGNQCAKRSGGLEISAFSRLYRVANAPIFFHDETFFGEGIVGGPMQVVAGQTKKAAEVALRILDGEKPGDIKPSFV